jgi:hypothetical protein
LSSCEQEIVTAARALVHLQKPATSHNGARGEVFSDTMSAFVQTKIP